MDIQIYRDKQIYTDIYRYIQIYTGWQLNATTRPAEPPSSDVGEIVTVGTYPRPPLLLRIEGRGAEPPRLRRDSRADFEPYLVFVAHKWLLASQVTKVTEVDCPICQEVTCTHAHTRSHARAHARARTRLRRTLSRTHAPAHIHSCVRMRA
jgi:hypothetical protein